MDQGISAAPSGYALRLLLAVFGAVAGIMLLSLFFGSSSASADDGDSPTLGSSLGGVVSSVTEPVQQTVTAVTTAVAPVASPVTAPVAKAPAVKPVVDAVETVMDATPVAAVVTPAAAIADSTVTKLLGTTIVGDLVGPTPVGSILAPVAALVDGTVADTGDLVVPAVPVVATAVSATDAASAAASTIPDLVSTAVTGSASGLIDLFDSPAPLPGTSGVSGTAPFGAGLTAALAAAGFLALLAVRRQTPTTRAMPGSPVYETDSSPD